MHELGVANKQRTIKSRVINKTLKVIMQSECRSVIDKFSRRFRSMQEFDPRNQLTKLLKYVRDLVKMVNKMSSEAMQRNCNPQQ